MADKSLDQSRTMMQAAESGMQGLQRASEYEGQVHQQNFQNTMQLAQMAAGAIQSHQQSKQQQGQFEARQQSEAQQFEAGQNLTREQMAQRSTEFQQSQGLEREQMAQRAQQFTEAQDLEAARSGLMRSQGQQQQPEQQQPEQQQPEGNAPQGSPYRDGQAPAGSPYALPPRQQRLQQEMDRGARQTQTMQAQPTPDDIRRQQQGQKPMEMGRSGRWVPTPEAERELQVKESLAETKRLDVIMRRQEMAARANFALMKGDVDTYQAAAESSAKSVSGIGKAYDRMMDGKATNDDWDNLAAEAKDLQSLDPAAYADIQAKKFTPRVQKLMRAGMMARSMEHIAQYGDDKDLYVDFASPQWKDYTERITMFSGIAASLGPEFAQFAGIRSLADKNRFLKRQAAMSMIYGMDQFRAADVTGEGMVTGGEMSNLLQQGQPQLRESMMPQPTMTPATAPVQQQPRRTDNFR